MMNHTLSHSVRIPGLITLLCATLLLTAVAVFAEPRPVIEPEPITAGYMSRYFALTNTEYTRTGDLIYFTQFAPYATTVTGPVHSNSIFRFMGTQANEFMSTSMPRWMFPDLTNPNGMRFSAPLVVFPRQAEEMRNPSSNSGTWLNTNGGEFTFGMEFQANSAIVWRWRTGTPEALWYGDRQYVISTITWGHRDFAIFCDGELWIKGHVSSRVAIGASGNIRLMDNLYYTGLDSFPGYWDTTGVWAAQHPTSPMLTIISEAQENADPQSRNSGILIANTPANGREQGRDRFGAHDRAHIVLCGSFMALNGSFTFEDQNDTWEAYQSPISGNDERGTIFLRGGVIQKRRGYVHRSNHNGTGYAKAYIYDPRLSTVRAPFSPEIINRPPPYLPQPRDTIH